LFFEKQAGITDQVKKFICVCVFWLDQCFCLNSSESTHCLFFFCSSQLQILSAFLNHCTALVTLVIESCENITDESIRHLTAVKNLELLRIKNCPNISEILVRQFKTLPNIRMLDYIK
jgi:hypothetical protein